jgi:beta-xylosidase/AraC-like DNA-binding protein
MFVMDFPITYQFKLIDSEPKQWHDYIEIIYVLSGQLTVMIKDQRYDLSDDQLILINHFSPYELSASQCKIASFHIYPSRFNNLMAQEELLHFDCNSMTAISEDDLTPIKEILAQIVKHTSTQSKEMRFLNYAHAYQLLHILLNRFHVKRVDTQDKNYLSHLQRLEKIIHYLNSHYAESITLKDLAEKFYITPPYLSNVFKKYMGTGFKDYLNTIRLNHATADLANPNWSLDFIADKNGFTSARSFSHIFKEKNHCLPSDYRNQQSNPTNKNTTRATINHDLNLGFHHHKDLGSLAKYLHRSELNLEKRNTSLQIQEISPISVIQKGFPLQHSFKKTTSIGKAKQILYAQNQGMLDQLQNDIGFDYIKFHGIFDDDMMVYSENATGQPQIDFTYVDMVFDFLLSIHLKPFLELSFMPKDLAQNHDRKIFYLESILSLPKDDDKWTLLIHQFVLHLINRYGLEEILSWHFFLWNEPDSPESMFGFDDSAAFFHFYKITYDTIKAIHPNISFGSPSMMTDTIVEKDWFKAFITYGRKQDCLPDFIHYHFYPVSHENDLNSDLIIHSNIVIDSDPDAFKNNIYSVKKTLKNLALDNKALYVTEWNSTISQRDLLNDTAFKATYIIKNILENYDALDSFGYWMISDFIEEVKMSEELFHGGMGLYTYNGIKKSSYYAFVLLNKLGDTLIGRGEGYFITKHKSKYQIILYNYQHFSTLYAAGELFDMTFTSRYTPFPNPTVKKFVIPLSDLTDEEYILTDTILNKDHGSSFDKWVELGALNLETQDESNYLKSISIPRITKQRLNVEKDYLTISRELQPHEVRFIEIHALR